MKLSPTLLLACTIFSATAYAEGISAFDCNLAIKSGDSAKALKIAEQLLAKDKNNREALICKAIAHGKSSDSANALTAAEQAEKLAKSPEEHMYGLTLIGDLEKNDGHLDQANSHFNQALKLSEQFNNKRFERIDRNKLGDILMLQNQPKMALEQFLAAAKLGMNDDERADDLERITASYKALGQQDKNLEYQIKSVQKIEALSDPERLANAYLELARLYTVDKSYSSAENTLNKLMKLSKEYDNQYFVAKTTIQLAKVKEAAGDKASAQSLKQEALVLANKIKADDLVKEIQAD